MYGNKSIFSGIVIISLVLLFSCKNEGKQQPVSQSEGTSISQAESSGSNSLSASDLRDASLNGNIELVRQAILQGVDVQDADELDRTAMMFAAYNGHTEIVQLLAKEGTEINKVNSEGRTSLMFAASGPFPETVEFLLENGASPNAKDNIEGWTPLMYAAAEGNTEVVELLLEYGADPNMEDTDGEKAIDFASNNGHTDVVTLLEN